MTFSGTAAGFGSKSDAQTLCRNGAPNCDFFREARFRIKLYPIPWSFGKFLGCIDPKLLANYLDDAIGVMILTLS